MRAVPSIASKLSELRNAFDRERALPLSSNTEQVTENLLAVRLDRSAYAIRVSEITGIAINRRIVGLPTRVSGLLGLAGVRGTLVPVYSLAALLGHDLEREQSRWLALCETDECFGLAFAELEGYLQIPVAHIYPAQQNETSIAHVTHVVQTADGARAVISVPLLAKTIQERCGGRSVPKER